MSRRTDRRRVFAKRFRTTLCKEFIETGTYIYGFDCLYAHCEADLRTEEMNKDLTSEMVVQWAEDLKQHSAPTSDFSVSFDSREGHPLSAESRTPPQQEPLLLPMPIVHARPHFFQQPDDKHCPPLRHLQLTKGLRQDHHHHLRADEAPLGTPLSLRSFESTSSSWTGASSARAPRRNPYHLLG